jgi:hypothetical protein
MKILINAFTLGIALLLSATSNAGTLSRSSALFSEATESSQQIKVLPAGSAVHVTGSPIQSNGSDWLPAEAGQAHGWILESAVELGEGDSGYVDPNTVEKRVSKLNLWGSFGPSVVTTNAMNWGARLATGMNFLAGAEQQWIIGFSISHPFDGETIAGNYASNIHRTTFLPTLGYYFVPHFFYAKAMAGLSVVDSDNINIGTALEPTFGAGIGFKVYQEKRFSFYIEGDYEFIERSAPDVLGFFSGINQALGESFDVTSLVPKANIYSINFVFCFDL